MLIVCATGLRAADLISAPEAPLGGAAVEVRRFAERRMAGEPLARIAGRREFWGLDFALTPDVLDPRADTETLVEAAMTEMRARRGEALRILDLGVGSGALLCALLTEFPFASGVGVDLSPGAATAARANAETLGLGPRADIRVGDWGAGLCGPFDLIVSNPPYVVSADIERLDREVHEHDPRLALDGGADGLNAYRALTPELSRLLERADGRFFLEFGRGQADGARAILESGGGAKLRVDAILKDLSGLERGIAGRRI
jgi:release factor glutamine methyltransferase